jgi:hypothetical protein
MESISRCGTLESLELEFGYAVGAELACIANACLQLKMVTINTLTNGVDFDRSQEAALMSALSSFSHIEELTLLPGELAAASALSPPLSSGSTYIGWCSTWVGEDC